MGKDKSGHKVDQTDNVITTLIKEIDPDIICLQETRCPPDLRINGFAYQKILASQTKKGYSGVGIFSKLVPESIIEFPGDNIEGRVICAEFKKFFLINMYVPNSKPDLSRLEYRVQTWEATVKNFIKDLQQQKPVVAVADWNVAPTELDIYSTKGKQRMHGFTIEERTAFAELLFENKLVDAFRVLYPDKKEYTWFSNFANSRARNMGWRIDTALVSATLKKKIKELKILGEFYGSDHVPFLLEIDST